MRKSLIAALVASTALAAPAEQAQSQAASPAPIGAGVASVQEKIDAANGWEIDRQVEICCTSRSRWPSSQHRDR